MTMQRADQIIKPVDRLKVGERYMVRELMRRAVVYSDNSASQILFDYYPPEFIDRIFQALGIQTVRSAGETENLITARAYANIFRILYNASYLTPQFSNEALSVLTQVTYKDGLTAKLPAGVLVAHKFAERTTTFGLGNAKTTVQQFHECALVYANKGDDSYTLCVMTEGSDYKALEKILQDISLEVYNSLIVDGGN